MVVGNGLIANAFNNLKDNDSILLFASGVSNSKTAVTEDFLREENLIREYLGNHSEKIFIYFSTTSIYNKEQNKSNYVLHKIQMEQIIRAAQPKHYILRLSNVVGKTENPNTIFNYLLKSLQKDMIIDVWLNAKRNLIDIKDVVEITSSIIKERGAYNSININSPFDYSILEILQAISDIHKIEPKIRSIDKGTYSEILNSDFNKHFTQFKDKYEYLNQLIVKYTS